MPGAMNHNSVKATGVIRGNHTRDTPGSHHLAGAPRLSPQHDHQPRHTVQGERAAERHSRPTAQGRQTTAPTSAAPLSTQSATTTLTSPTSAASLSTQSATTTLTSPSSSLSISVSSPLPSPSSPSSLLLTTSPSSSAKAAPPLSCPTTTGTLSTRTLYPNNAALLEACGIPRPSSPSQLSPKSKLASVFSSYPSLKPSQHCPSSPPISNNPSQSVDESSELSSLDNSSLSISNSEDTSLNLSSDASTSKDTLPSSSSSSLLSPLSSSLMTPQINNTITNTNNSNNNNNSSNASNAPLAFLLPSSRGAEPHTAVTEKSHGCSDTHQDVNDAPSRPDSNSARQTSKSKLQLPREKAVVVPSSPPRDHKALTVTHQVQPLKPSRLAQIRQNNLAIKKQMKTKSMKLPELSETSEADTPSPVTEVIATTNSSPSPLQPLPPHGSPYQQRRSSSPALNSDRPPPTAKVMPQISITDEDGLDIVPACPPGSDPSTPLTLPQAFLRKLGLAVEDDDKDTSVDQLSEKEIESKFVTLSLAFKTDKLTLDQRVIVQERARDLAEQNVDAELQGIRDAIETLGDLAFDPQVRDVVEKIRLHIDVLEISAAKVSSRAEVFGAVQQERRLCKAMEVMVQYTENLRRIRAKEESEVQEARKVLSERSGVGYTLDVDSAGPARRSMSVCGFSPGIRTMRRRSEVALPRILGGTGSPSPAQEGDIFHPERLPASHSFSNIHQAPEEEEGPKARFQSAVASTSMQHAVTATMRRTSTDRERRVSLAAPVSPLVTNGAGSGNSVGVDGSNGKLKKMSPQPSLSVTVEDEGDSCEASETSTSETTPARKVSQDEQAYRKGFEQGLKAKLNEQLTQLRDQQNNISQSLEAVMDRVDQGESEEAEFLASPTRLETLLTVTAKVREYVLAYDWRSNKTAIRNLAGVAFLLLAVLMMFISPPLPAHTQASSIDSPPNHPSLPRH